MTFDIFIRYAVESDAEALGKLVVDTWRETYGGIFPEDFFENFTYEKQISRAKAILSGTASISRPAIAIKATGEPVGYAFSGPNRNASIAYESELHTLYVLADHHGQGIGKRLFGFVVHGEIKRGSSSIFTWVVATNPTRAFYAKIGGTDLGMVQKRAFGSKNVEEVALGWSDIKLLQQRLSTK